MKSKTQKNLVKKAAKRQQTGVRLKRKKSLRLSSISTPARRKLDPKTQLWWFLSATTGLVLASAWILHWTRTATVPVVEAPPPVVVTEAPPVPAEVVTPAVVEAPPVVVAEAPPVPAEVVAPAVVEAPPVVVAEAPPVPAEAVAPAVVEAPPVVVAEAPPVPAEAVAPAVVEAPPVVVAEAPPVPAEVVTPAVVEAPPAVVAEAPAVPVEVAVLAVVEAPPAVVAEVPAVPVEVAAPVVGEAPAVVAEAPAVPVEVAVLAVVEAPPVVVAEAPPMPSLVWETEFNEASSLSVPMRLDYWGRKITEMKHLGLSWPDFGPPPSVADSQMLLPEIFDCTTFVETALALARSQDSRQFYGELLKIRYDGLDTTFYNRNHFPEADWVPHNIQVGVLEDITRSIANTSTVESSRVRKEISRSRWLENQVKGGGVSREIASLPPEPWMKKADAEIEYLPISKMDKWSEQLPDGAIINIVRDPRPSKDVLITHQGVISREGNQILFRHVNSKRKIQILPLKQYLSYFKDASWPVVGVNVLLPR